MGALILVIEDDALNRRLVTILLEADGHEVLPAESAEEGLRQARERHPALILSDSTLPSMDGIAGVRALKADPATRGIPVVMVSAHIARQYVDAAFAAGCIGYLTKPLEVRSFAASIRKYLQLGKESPS